MERKENYLFYHHEKITIFLPLASAILVALCYIDNQAGGLLGTQKPYVITLYILFNATAFLDWDIEQFFTERLNKNGTSFGNSFSKIMYSKSEILGRGSGSTIIYKGLFGGRQVAVKKIAHFQSHTEAENEIKFLIRSSGLPNIVQYYAFEKNGNIFYLVLELCQQGTLRDWVMNKGLFPQLQIDSVEILRQASKGLGYLHSIDIIHRDLKPSNILFLVVGKYVFVKLSDYGISRLLDPRRNCGTVTSFGWMSSEMLAAEKRYTEMGTKDIPGIPLTKKLDIFSLGCIFYYVFTNGQYLFANDANLYYCNIERNFLQIKSKEHCLRLRCNLSLILKMVAFDPNDRPEIEDILAHPIFWSNQKIINFLVELSNFIHNNALNDTVTTCIANLEASYFHKISNGSKDGWFDMIEGPIRDIFEKKYSCHKNSVKGLIRLIRNLNNHLDEKQNKNIKNLIGEKPDTFLNFWLDKFPMLVNETRKAFRDLREESILKQFY